MFLPFSGLVVQSRSLFIPLAVSSRGSDSHSPPTSPLSSPSPTSRSSPTFFPFPSLSYPTLAPELSPQSNPIPTQP